MFPEIFRDDVFMLETPRLFLRWPKASDAQAVTLLAGERRVSEMTAPIPHPYHKEDAVKFVLDSRAANAEGKGLSLVIAERGAPGAVIGAIGLRMRPDRQVSLGYWLGLPHWGKGFATEAGQAIVDAAFLYTPLHEMVSSVRVINPASRKVLEHCGFQYEASAMLARPAWGDSVPCDTYRLTRSLWTSLKGWRAPIPQGREMMAEGM